MHTRTSFTARCCMLVAVLFCTASLAEAYTLVLKSGRRLQVGDNIVVSGPSVICDMGNDISMSFQLATIDIPATERANHELPGTFLKRSRQSPITTSDEQATTRSKSSITNSDLERYRRRRVASEKAYEARRKELGLPSPVESRTIAANAARTVEVSPVQPSPEQTQEQYWRGRASQLRSEISATDAQINYLQGRLSEMPTDSVAGIVSTYPTFPYGPYSNYPYGSRTRVSPNIGPVFTPGPHIIPQIGPVITQQPYPYYRNRYPWGGIFGRRSPFENWPILTAPYSTQNPNEASYQAMIQQLEQLRLQRVKLQSLWRDLEEEARRAGAYPGWLRP
jgi:hypothetical protein